jgi:two-component SAPR family response regulator
MATLVDQLHDQIDFEEDLRERARDVVEELRGSMADAVEETGDVTEAMELIAMAVDNALNDLTTEAVQKSFQFARRLGDGKG